MSPRTRVYLYQAITKHVEALRRDGIDGPAITELETLAARLLASLGHDLERDRVRSLAAARKARQRARERGENVPLRKPGPAPSRRSEARCA